MGWGTGTIVSVSGDRSLVVTAAHVINDRPNRITVIHPTGNYAAQVLKVGQGADLAALEIAAVPNVRGIAIAEPGSKLGVMFGFGGSNLLHQHSGKYLSPARRLSDAEADNRFGFASDQGDSGGPVINERGELFGILWGGDSSTSVIVSTAKLRRFLFDDEKCFRFFRRGPRQINVTVTNPPAPVVIPAPAPAPIDPVPANPVTQTPSVVVGPSGPAGPIGPQGPSGPVGPQGPAGVPGTAVPVDPSIAARIAALEAIVAKPITFLDPKPDGTETAQQAFLGDSVRLKIPTTPISPTTVPAQAKP